MQDAPPIRDTMWLLEYDNYWTGDKMVEHAARVALPVFHYAFPNCQALFAIDNAPNHCSFSEDVLVSKRMNLNPGGQQPIMREGFDYEHGLPQAIVFSNTHHISELLKLRYVISLKITVCNVVTPPGALRLMAFHSIALFPYLP